MHILILLWMWTLAFEFDDVINHFFIILEEIMLCSFFSCGNAADPCLLTYDGYCRNIIEALSIGYSLNLAYERTRMYAA